MSESLLESLEGLAPEERLGSYKCQRRSCSAIYDIPAAAFLNAR